MRLIDAARRVAASDAKSVYWSSFEHIEARLRSGGVYDNPLRQTHFMAQAAYETGGFRVLRESMYYTSTEQLMKIFGKGRHSAAITLEEAPKFLRNEYALAERAYGVDNPGGKGRKLGNLRPGDGHLFRGNGGFQITGGLMHKEFGAYFNADFFGNPDIVCTPEYIMAVGVHEWITSGCNKYADLNDIDTVTRIVNGGTNGLTGRKAYFAKLWPLITDQNPKSVQVKAWASAEPSERTRTMQRALNALGYGLKEDGLLGAATTKALRDFQGKNGLDADGMYGPLTEAALGLALRRRDAGAPDKTPAVTLPSAGTVANVGKAVTGGAAVVTGAAKAADKYATAGQQAKDTAQQILDTGIGDWLPWVGGIATVIVCIGVLLIAAPQIKAFFHKEPEPA